MQAKRPLLTLKPKVKTAFLGLKSTSSNSRQGTRALNTNSKEWKRIRAEVLKRDLYRCQGVKGQHVDGCNGFANEVDHVDGDSHNNHEGNLSSLSKHCHSAKTAREMLKGFGL